MTALSAVTAPSPDVLALAREAASEAVAALVAEATRRVRDLVMAGVAGSRPRGLEADQHPVHGLAWLATYAEAVRELAAMGSGSGPKVARRDRGTPLPIGLGEYLAQTFGGMPMSQGEIVRPRRSD